MLIERVLCVLNTLCVLVLLTTTAREDYYYFTYFISNLGTEMVSNLPQVTQL